MKDQRQQTGSMFDAFPAPAAASEPFSWEPCLETERTETNTLTLIGGQLQETLPDGTLGPRIHYESTAKHLVEFAVFYPLDFASIGNGGPIGSSRHAEVLSSKNNARPHSGRLHPPPSRRVSHFCGRKRGDCGQVVRRAQNAGARHALRGCTRFLHRTACRRGKLRQGASCGKQGDREEIRHEISQQGKNY